MMISKMDLFLSFYCYYCGDSNLYLYQHLITIINIIIINDFLNTMINNFTLLLFITCIIAVDV